MIGKKVVNAKGGHSKAARIGSLLDYIRAPETALSEEKCIHYGGQGFLTDSPGGHRAEMIALAQDAVRSADTVNHYILSWREGEVPTLDQVDHAVTLLVDELGLRGHQIVYGLHADTDNVHLHVVVNRVHPDTLRAVKINGGFDIEALHRAVARIEHAQGWQPEQRARYQVSASGQVERSPAEQARSPARSKADREARCGIQSAERIAIDQAAPVIAAAASWESLHAGLAAVGMRYERSGSGAKVFVGETPIKWLRNQGQHELAEQWRYRQCASQALSLRGAVRTRPTERVHTQVSTGPHAQQDLRQASVEHAWSQYARDVAALKRASRQRWAAVRLLATGPITGKLWALNARRADQNAWRRLHERHHQALRAAQRAHEAEPGARLPLTQREEEVPTAPTRIASRLPRGKSRGR